MKEFSPFGAHILRGLDRTFLPYKLNKLAVLLFKRSLDHSYGIGRREQLVHDHCRHLCCCYGRVLARAIAVPMLSVNILFRRVGQPLHSIGRLPLVLKNNVGRSESCSIAEVSRVLREENAKDLCVVRMPVEINYADYLVSASGTSTRHLRAVAEGLSRNVRQSNEIIASNLQTLLRAKRNRKATVLHARIWTGSSRLEISLLIT